MMRSCLSRGGSLRGRLGYFLLGLCISCFPISYAVAHGGGSGSGGGGGSGGSGSSSGSSGNGGSAGHGGSSMGGASMGGSAGAGPTSFNGPGNGSVSGGTGHGSNTGHSGHSSSVTGAHGTAVAHNATKAVAKDATTLNQLQFHRPGFTSDTMIERPFNRVRFHQESSTGGFTPETYKKKRKIYHPIQSNAGNAQNAVTDRR